MNVTKCDICKKEIRGRKVVTGIKWDTFDLCQSCGFPVVKFMEKHKLIKKEKNEKK